MVMPARPHGMLGSYIPDEKLLINELGPNGVYNYINGNAYNYSARSGNGCEYCHWSFGPGRTGPRTKISNRNFGPLDHFHQKK